MPPTPDTCLNCSTLLAGPYCHSCGQEAGEKLLPLRRLLTDGLGDLFTFDSRIARTVRCLFARPGFLSAQWREGRRARYVPPLRLYLFVAAVFFLVLRVADVQFVQIQAGMTETGERPTDEQIAGAIDERPLLEKLVAAEALGQDELQARLVERLGTVSLLLPPLFAALLMLAYRRRRRFYVEHLVFALHLHAVVFLVLAVTALVPWETVRQWIAVGVVVPGLAVYLVLALRRAYGGRLWATLLRAAGLALVYVGTAVPLALVLALVWISTTL